MARNLTTSYGYDKASNPQTASAKKRPPTSRHGGLFFKMPSLIPARVRRQK